MIHLTAETRILLATQPADFRCGIDGFATLCRHQLNQEPRDGTLPFFLGGLEKSRFLKAFKPHIFFDDQDSHLDPASIEVPSAKVLYPSNSVLNKIMQDKANVKVEIM